MHLLYREQFNHILCFSASLCQISSKALLLLEKSIAKQAAAQFETKVRQQSVAN